MSERRGARKIETTRTSEKAVRYGFVFLLSNTLFAIFGITPWAQAQSVAVTAGYRDFSFGASTNSEPTYGKSESKLWWNDSFWWGMLWNSTTNRYEIYRFNVATQSWIGTNIAADTRNGSRADVLWDGQHLYIASHFYTTTAGPVTSTYFSKLYRYAYNTASKQYSLDPGFPVNINSSNSETLTLDKDSTGKLWVTWVENSKVMINQTLGSDLTWGTPFILPVQGNDTDPDDISALVAFGGNKIGVMWSNQKDSTDYLAVHVDGNADATWQPREIALSGRGLGRVSDDHVCLKASRDGSGNLYAATLTNLSGAPAARVFVLKRSSTGMWTRHVWGTVSLNHSRPQLVVDDENQRLHVFARSNDTGAGNIYLKSASLKDLVFPAGLGTSIIQSPTDLNLSNPTSTKQSVNRTTGILILAADKDSRYYLHSYINLNSAPQITAFTPSKGSVGTQVTITGSQFTGTAAVSFNGKPASFIVVSDTQLRATVPVGATTGAISISNFTGTVVSPARFVVLHALKVSNLGSGTVRLNPTGGVYNEGEAVTLTAAPAPSWLFYKWGGNLVGSNPTMTLTMNDDKQVTAEFRAIPKFVVAIKVVGPGSVSLSPPGGTYYTGTEITLTATPAAGYVFSGYAGDFKGWKNVETMTINASKNLIATFSPLPAPRFATGIWTSAAEVSKLPISGLGWDNLKAGADEPIGPPNLSDNEDSVGVVALAKALVYSRTGNEAYRQAVISACMTAIGTERDGDALAFGRELLAYVLAADLVGLPPANEATFRNWLRNALTENLKGQTLQSSHEGRANNWGPRCGATRAAIARYLGDAAELERTARVFKGWLGDRNTYADFSFDGDLSWQANPNTPVGINPLGAKIQGHPVDGVLPDDQRRAGPFSWPPPKENYVYGALQGALMEAIILYRAGYDVWNWQDQALFRAVKWLYQVDNYPADGDDEWLPHIINHFYRTRFPAPFPAQPGKNAGWTDWLYGSKYALTMSDNNGKVEIHSLGVVKDSLVAMKLTAISSPGYLFKGWSDGLSGAKNPDTLIMNANKNVIANFVKAGPFTVNVTPVGSGTVTLNPSGGIYAGGTVVTLTAKPAPGSKFIGWSNNLGGSTNPVSLTITANKNITATFKEVYNLNLNIIGAGTISLYPPPNGPYEVGTVVTLTATPNAGYSFTEWGGALAGVTNNPATLVMNANKNVTATFMAARVVHEETQTGGASGSTMVTTATNLTGVKDHLYLAAIATRPKLKVNSLAGLGLTWKFLQAQCSGRNNIGVELWMAQGTPTGNSPVTATLAAIATNAVIAVTRYSGVAATDPVGNIIAGNTKGLNGVCAGGVDASSYSLNLTTTVNGATVYGAIGMRNKTNTPGTSCTERAEIQQGSSSAVAKIAVEDKIVPVAGTTTINGAFSGTTDWAVVAIEIRPQPENGLVINSELEKNMTTLAVPDKLMLLQNYPNPFNPSTVISYGLPNQMHVTLKIFNVNGQVVATLSDALQPAGHHEVVFDASHLPSGNYFTVLLAGDKKFVRRIVLMK